MTNLLYPHIFEIIKSFLKPDEKLWLIRQNGPNLCAVKVLVSLIPNGRTNNFFYENCPMKPGFLRSPRMLQFSIQTM